jgi:hypothetical protein
MKTARAQGAARSGKTDGETVYLNAKNVRGQVVVTPDNENRFVVRMAEAIAACEGLEQNQRAQDKYNLLLTRLATWIGKHAASVRDAYVTTRDNGLCFIVVQKSPAYDRGFQDAVAELDWDIANDPDIPFALEVMAVPPAPVESLRSILGSGGVLKFRGGKRK